MIERYVGITGVFLVFHFGYYAINVLQSIALRLSDVPGASQIYDLLRPYYAFELLGRVVS